MRRPKKQPKYTPIGLLKPLTPAIQNIPPPPPPPTPEGDRIVEAITGVKRSRKPPAPVTITLPALQPQDERAIRTEAHDVCISASIIAKRIHNRDDEQAVADYRREVIKKGKSRIDEIFLPLLKAQKDSYDGLRSTYNELHAPFDKADRLLLDAVTQYTQEQRRQHEEAQRLEREEQRKRQLQALLDQNRKREELAASIEAQMEKLSISGIEVTDEMLDAVEAPLREYEASISRAKEQPAQAMSVQVAPPATSGQFTLQDNWKCEVTDVQAVVKGVLDGTLPWSLLEVKLPEANKLASLHKDTKRLPGLRFYNEPFSRGVGGRK